MGSAHHGLQYSMRTSVRIEYCSEGSARVPISEIDDVDNWDGIEPEEIRFDEALRLKEGRKIA